MDAFFMEAFEVLGTERQMGMAYGPVPWSRAMEYAAWVGLDDGATRLFWEVLRQMDAEFLAWQGKKSEG